MCLRETLAQRGDWFPRNTGRMRAAMAARVAWPCVWIVVAVVGITALFDRLARPHSNAVVAIQAALLWLLGYAVLTNGTPRVSRTSRFRALAHLMGAACVTITCVLLVRPALFSRAQLGWVCSITFVAFVEEMVFRVLLPGRMTRALSLNLGRGRALAVAVALSQLTFGASHLLPTNARPDGLGPAAFMGLTASGLALWAIIERVGIWTAASLHALVNISLILAPMPSGMTIPPPVAALWIAGGVCLATCLPMRMMVLAKGQMAHYLGPYGPVRSFAWRVTSRNPRSQRSASQNGRRAPTRTRLSTASWQALTGSDSTI